MFFSNLGKNKNVQSRTTFVCRIFCNYFHYTDDFLLQKGSQKSQNTLQRKPQNFFSIYRHNRNSFSYKIFNSEFLT